MRTVKALVLLLLMAASASAQLPTAMTAPDYSFKARLNVGNGSTVATHPSLSFQVYGTTTASRPWPVLTTTQRNAIASPILYGTIINSSTGRLEWWNGSTWVGVSAAASVPTFAQILAASNNGGGYGFTNVGDISVGEVTAYSLTTNGPAQIGTVGNGASLNLNNTGLSTGNVQINGSNITDNRIHFLPNKTGTYAMLDDIPAPAGIADVLTVNNDAGGQNMSNLFIVEAAKVLASSVIGAPRIDVSNASQTGTAYIEFANSPNNVHFTIPDDSPLGSTVYAASRQWVTAQGYSTSTYTNANARAALSMTTTGTGAASYNGTTGVINVPTPTIPTDNASLTNGAGYITSSALSPYLTTTSAASTYLPLAGGTVTGATQINRASSEDFLTLYNTTTGAPAAKIAAIGTPFVAYNPSDATEYMALGHSSIIRRVGVSTFTISWPVAAGTLALTSAIPTNNNVLTNGAGYLTSSSAASTYAPLTRSNTAGYGLSGGGTFAADRSFVVDTFAIAARARVQKAVDSLNALIAANSASISSNSSAITTLQGQRYTKTSFNAWTNGTTAAASSTTYYGAAVSGGTFSTEAARQSVTSVSGVARNLYIRATGTQPSPGDVTITMRVNGASTALVVTIPAGSTTGTFSDVTHTVTIANGDLIGYQITNAAAAASIPFNSFSFEITNN